MKGRLFMLFTKGKKFKISCVAIMLVLAMLLSSVVVLPVSADTDYANVAQSRNLVFGSTYSGIAGDSKYTFTLQQSGRVSVTCSNKVGDYGWIGLSIQIYDSANSRFVDYSISGGKSASVYVDLLAGDYALFIYSYFDDIPYSFTANFTSAGETVSESDMSKNDDITTATSYKLGKKVNAQLACNEDKDVYKFKVSKAGYVNLTLTNKQLKSVNFSIIDEVGEISYDTCNLGIGTTKYKYFVKPGTYYLTVEGERKDTGYTGTYTISTSYSAIPKPTLKTAKNVSKKSLKLTWSKKSGITGYQVQIATSKNFKKGKKTYTYEGNTIGNAKIKKLKKKTTYYVRVRTYVSAGNGQKYYSSWSSVKKITIKK
jgi:hypothetical protein